MDRSMLRIGVSGHQQIGDEATIEFVSQQLHGLLSNFSVQRHEHGQNIIAYSALAIGTDRLFVKTALELGIPVEVIIPCSHYEDIYDSPEVREDTIPCWAMAAGAKAPFSSQCSGVSLAPSRCASSNIHKIRYGIRTCTLSVHSYSYSSLCILYIEGSFVYSSRSPRLSTKREIAVEKQTAYQGQVLTEAIIACR